MPIQHTPANPRASAPFRDRPPTRLEFERLRLTLSSYRDGSGQQATAAGTMPGWRDFERTVASVLGGRTMENKAVFDVEVSAEPLGYALSCKTSTLRTDASAVLMELSNSPAKFEGRLRKLGIDAARDPGEACCAVIDLIREWHEAERGRVDVDSSSYLVLVHDPAYVHWRLFWFPLDLTNPDPRSLQWQQSGRRIAGFDQSGDMIWEWYPESGGQLKYRPLIASALWDSGWFELEEPPIENPAQKAARYWPDSWAASKSEA